MNVIPDRTTRVRVAASGRRCAIDPERIRPPRSRFVGDSQLLTSILGEGVAMDPDRWWSLGSMLFSRVQPAPVNTVVVTDVHGSM